MRFRAQLIAIATLAAPALYAVEISPDEIRLWLAPGESAVESMMVGLPRPLASLADVQIAFVLDRTASMTPAIAAARAAAEQITDSLVRRFPHGRWGLASYDDFDPAEPSYHPFGLVRDLTGDPQEVRSMLGSIRVDAVPFNHDAPEAVTTALIEAALSFDWRANGPKYVVLLGDSTAKDDPRAQLDQALAMLRERQIHVVAIHVDTAGFGRYRREVAATFRSIAEGTGGRYFRLNDSGRIADFLLQAIGVSTISAPVLQAEPAFSSWVSAVLKNVDTNRLSFEFETEFRVPRGARAGVFDFALQARDRASGATLGSVPAQIRVGWINHPLLPWLLIAAPPMLGALLCRRRARRVYFAWLTRQHPKRLASMALIATAYIWSAVVVFDFCRRQSPAEIPAAFGSWVASLSERTQDLAAVLPPAIVGATRH